MNSEAFSPIEDSREQDISKLGQRIRIAQFELEHAQREKKQAELEIASIQKPFGASPSEYEIIANQHRDEAVQKINYYSTELSSAEKELKELTAN